MGSGAARKRAARQKTRHAAPATSQAATWNPSTYRPDSRAQRLQGWQSLHEQGQAFTLDQEARNTHRTAWNESNRLRNNAILFVSGGNLSQDNPDKKEQSEDDDAEHAENTMEEEEVPAKEADVHPNNEIEDINSNELDKSITKRVEEMDLSFARPESFFTRTRSASASSTSSSEVILFAGRGKPQKKSKPVSTPPTPQIARPGSLGPESVGESSLGKPLPANTPSRLKPDAAEFIPAQSMEPTPRYSSRSQATVVLGGRPTALKGSNNRDDQESSEGRQRRGRRPLLERYADEEEAILRDYIDNVKETSNVVDEASADENERHRGYREPRTENRKVPVVASVRQANIHGAGADNDWSSDDLRDFDELDTSADELTDIDEVLSRRDRPSGIQYLVTPTGQTADFAKWILHANLTSIHAKELIVAFEETHPEVAGGSEDHDDEDQWDDSSSEESAEEALNDLLRDQESEHNENERILEHTSRMTDAELARILNKQAELGIDTDDLVLFDGTFERSQDFIPFSTKTHTSNRTRSKQNRRSRRTFPSAEAFADVLDEDPYNGFDVMDFERPSLKAKKKGRKSANGLPFELEDDELADQLAQSWANDRTKKASRKAEREELRQAGLLGSRAGNGRVDLQTKYKNNGMDMDQVKAEVRAFLLDGVREALALAPMSSPQRAQVHLLAKALHLKSHSQGKGDTRFPILTKTDFSGRYDEDNISHIDALLAQRKYSTRWGKKDKSAPRPGARARRSGGGGVAAGATYMDGDVVGASAPELGSENKGRAMLERMGWSSGMGIGKVGNKGSVEVIKHVVKNSKAGLG
jgi:R3H domain/G-patch domain